jgi:hypothetical protein
MAGAFHREADLALLKCVWRRLDALTQALLPRSRAPWIPSTGQSADGGPWLPALHVTAGFEFLKIQTGSPGGGISWLNGRGGPAARFFGRVCRVGGLERHGTAGDLICHDDSAGDDAPLSCVRAHRRSGARLDASRRRHQQTARRVKGAPAVCGNLNPDALFQSSAASTIARASPHWRLTSCQHARENGQRRCRPPATPAP